MNPDSHLPAPARPPGADYYGVADLTGVQDFIRSQGGNASPAIPGRS